MGYLKNPDEIYKESFAAIRRETDLSRLPKALHDLGSYYKWPLALATLGRMELARQLFDTLIDSFLRTDGDFRTAAYKSGDPLYGQIADTYTNTWPIVAARVLERPEVGEASLEFPEFSRHSAIL